MKVSIIAAIGKNRELGKDNKLIWHIKEDMQRFKSLTSGHPIIMGRKTWDSLPFKPLPNRTNIIVTRDPTSLKLRGASKQQVISGAIVVGSVEEGIEIAKRHSGERSQVPDGTWRSDSRIDSGQRAQLSQARMTEEIFIIGGGQIYKEALEKKLVDKLYLTIVDADFDADTFFPDYSDFKKVVFEKEGKSEKYKYKFLELERS